MPKTTAGVECSPHWRQQRSRVAGLQKHHPDGHPLLDAARAELDRLGAKRRAERFVAEVLPGLDAEQRRRLAAACATSDTAA